MKSLGLAFLLTISSSVSFAKGFAASEATMEADRKYMWLESVEGETALNYVKELNASTVDRLKKDPQFADRAKKISNIIFDENRIEPVSVMDGWVYSFWKDKKNPRGLWRKTKIESYATATPAWETIIDIDALAKSEKANWVFKGVQILKPDMKLALVNLSNGGKDAVEVREFNLETKKFVTNGFKLPEAKTHVSWLDKDTLVVATDFGPNTMTTSGYAKQVKIWKRGTDLKKAEMVMDVMPTDMVASGVVLRDEGRSHVLLVRKPGFFEEETSYLKSDGERVTFPVSKDVEVVGLYKDLFLLKLEKDFSGFKKGSLLSMPLKSLLEKGKGAVKDLKVVFAPTKKTFLNQVSRTKNDLVIELTDNVESRVERLYINEKGKWIRERFMPELSGSVSLQSTDELSDYILLRYMDFLTPATLYGGDVVKKDFKVLKSTPAQFDASNLEYKQYHAKSADGTKIPYYLVSAKNLKKNGKNPTVINAYGGFGVSETSFYSGVVGKMWLEQGGVFVLANLRGGGEFGPDWHQQVLKEKRYKVVEDLIAVGEDLIKNKITSKSHLGIWGGSNGGLLVGATMVKRPDLFNAVLCQVPLLDMIRYNKLLAGASWMDEYGNPDDPKIRKAILKYSPFQNVQKDVKYPEIFFMTSTKDDRVHPGHARKMAAKMKDQGHDFLYYENIDGGHGGNANQDQEVLWQNLVWTYLWEKLGVKETK